MSPPVDNRGLAELAAILMPFAASNDIEFSGEPQSLKKRDEGTRVRCNELLDAAPSGTPEAITLTCGRP